MKNTFLKTKNVKMFTTLMDTLKNLPVNVPKMALVYGEQGLGKTETLLWWVMQNYDIAIYVRANNKMTSRWLMHDILSQLDTSRYGRLEDNFNAIEKQLKVNPKIIIVDEVDYLIANKSIETLRDIHDKTGIPIVLVGMADCDRKLSKLSHIYGRLYSILKFQAFNKQDINEIVTSLSDIEFSDDAIDFIANKTNKFREIAKIIDKIEKLSKTNSINYVDAEVIRNLLYERKNIATLQTPKYVQFG